MRKIFRHKLLAHCSVNYVFEFSKVKCILLYYILIFLQQGNFSMMVLYRTFSRIFKSTWTLEDHLCSFNIGGLVHSTNLIWDLTGKILPTYCNMRGKTADCEIHNLIISYSNLVIFWFLTPYNLTITITIM